MSVDESALAVLIKKADWAALKDGMAAKNFGGEAIVNELTDEHMAEVEKLADDSEKVEAVLEEMDVPAEEA